MSRYHSSDTRIGWKRIRPRWSDQFEALCLSTGRTCQLLRFGECRFCRSAGFIAELARLIGTLLSASISVSPHTSQHWGSWSTLHSIAGASTSFWICPGIGSSFTACMISHLGRLSLSLWSHFGRCTRYWSSRWSSQWRFFASWWSMRSPQNSFRGLASIQILSICSRRWRKHHILLRIWSRAW